MPTNGSLEEPTQEAQQRASLHRRRDYTLIISNGGKVAAIVLGLLEAAGDHPNKASLIFYGFLILGAQKAEDVIVNAIDRVLGK